MTNRELLISAIGEVDSAFITEHVDHKITTPVKKFMRFALPASIYAAACIAALLLIPYITGNSPDTPPPDDPKPVVTDTIVTGKVAESEEITETVSAEMSKSAESSADETTEAPVTEELPEEPDTVAPEPVEPPQTVEPVVPEPSVVPTETTTTATAVVTTEEPRVQRADPPEEMEYVDSSTVPYYNFTLSYENGLLFDYTTDFEDRLMSEPVYTGYDSFRQLYDEYVTVVENGQVYNDTYHLSVLEIWGKFDEAFFEEYNLLFLNMSFSSGSIYYKITNVSVSDKGHPVVHYNVYEPGVQTGDWNPNLHLLAIKKEYTCENPNLIHQKNVFIESYNYYTGKTEYIPDNRIPSSSNTYFVKSLPDSLKNENFRIPYVIRSNEEFIAFRNEVSALCEGDESAYLSTDYLSFVSAAEKTEAFWSNDYVYIGIYDIEYIRSNGYLKADVGKDGVLNISIPVPEDENSVNPKKLYMCFITLPKHILDDAKGVTVTEVTTTEEQPVFQVCPVCKKTISSVETKVWVYSIEPDYLQTGKIFIMVNNSVTREIFKEGANTTPTVIEKYFSDIEYEEISSCDYTNNPALVQEIISGEFKYKLMISVTLEDKSVEYLTEVLSRFGCKLCSDFEYCFANY